MTTENLSNPGNTLNLSLELLPPEGQRLDIAQTLVVPDILANPEGQRAPETFDAGGLSLTGVPRAVIRAGGAQEHSDLYVLDVRDQPVSGQDSQGNVMRVIGVKDGQDIKFMGDFVLVSPSADGQSMQMRGLMPGKKWEIGRDGGRLGSESAGHFPDTVSRDQCAIMIDEQGGLVVENHTRSNNTTVLRPETVDRQPKPEILSQETAIDLLSYDDVLSGEQAAAARSFTETDPSGQKYAATLVEMSREVGKEELLATASALREACLHSLEKIGIPPSEYAGSQSWALWDMAKQRYMLEHPGENGEGYYPADPLAKNEDGVRILDDIVSRHVGWEYERAYHESHGTPRHLAMNVDAHTASKIIRHGERNKKDLLRSRELLRLGNTVSR